MRPISIATLVLTTLLGVGAGYWIDAGEKPPRHWPKPTPPPPPSPIYTPSREHAWTEEEIAQQARGHNARLEMEIERALIAKDQRRLEAVFTFILPELVQVDPERVVAMVTRQQPGESRDILLTEVTRQWVESDTQAAIRWMKTLSQDERLVCATTAIDSIVAHSPAEAAAIAVEFGIASPRLQSVNASRD